MTTRYRIDYSKLEGMRYTSNLDIHKMWERTFRRAKLPLKYSQGFHPQPKIQQANPLPLGFLSKNELVDFYLEDEYSIEKLTNLLIKALPPGISINTVDRIDPSEPTLQKRTDSSEYQVLFLEEIRPNDLEEKINELLEMKSVKRIRRGKTYDLRPLIHLVELHRSNPPFLRMVLSAKDGATGRPDEILNQLGIPLETTRIIREKTILSAPEVDIIEQ